MSKKELFNTVQRKYLQRETTLSPAGESVAETPKFNKVQSKYIDGINALPDGTAGGGAFAAPPPPSFRTGAHSGEKSRGFADADRAAGCLRGSLAALGMTSGSRPEQETMDFRAPKLRPEEKQTLYTDAVNGLYGAHISSISKRQSGREDTAFKKTKQHQIPPPLENNSVSPGPVKNEPPQPQTGQYEAKTGKTWFDYDGKEVWADMETLQGVGVLPDGTFVNAAKGDRFAKPVYDVIYQRDSGQISKEEADQRLDAIAWEIAGSEYPNEEDLSLRNENYFETSARLKSRTIDYYIIPDITDGFNRTIESEEKAILDDLSKWGLKVEGEHVNKNAFLAFNFWKGAKYDLKEKDDYKEHSLFVYNGEIMSRDDFGNLLYGYLGTACGMSEKTLLSGGGAFQILSRKSKPEWGKSGGDDPRDSARISEGVRLFYEKHPELSQTEREYASEEETLRESISWWLS